MLNYLFCGFGFSQSYIERPFAPGIYPLFPVQISSNERPPLLTDYFMFGLRALRDGLVYILLLFSLALSFFRTFFYFDVGLFFKLTRVLGISVMT